MTRALLCLSLLLGGCIGRIEQHGAPTVPYDLVVVPGCPSEDDGRPSRCQLSRAIWATVLWERGWAKGFITSGADVHSPHVEADALAQVMVALGVPADKIWLERDALHTDENMFFSLRIARRLGARTIAVASQKGHAAWGCRMMIDWGQPCSSLSVDLDTVRARAQKVPAGVLEALRLPPVSPWVELAERERRLTARSGRRRPSSWMLYPALALMRVSGETWVPVPPVEVPITTWRDAQALVAP